MTRMTPALRHAMTPVAIALAMVAIASPARAQAPDPNDPGFTFVVTPMTIPTNGRVTFSGLGAPDRGMQIHFTIAGPGGHPSTVVASPASNGHYTVDFGDTQAQGAYTVTATAGANGKPIRGQFTVRTYLVNFSENIAKSKALLTADSTLVDNLKKALDNIPDSPTKQDMGKKLDALKKVTDKGPAQAANLQKAIQPFVQLVQSHPETVPIVQPIFDHLSDLADEAAKTTLQVNTEITESKAKLADCDQIDKMTQSIKAVPQVFSVALKPFDFVGGVAQFISRQADPSATPTINATADAFKMASSLNSARKGADEAKAWAKLQSTARSTLTKDEIATGFETEYGKKLAESIPAELRATPGYKLAVKEIKQFLPQIVASSSEPKAIYAMGAKIAGDLLAFGTEQFFSKYCQKFEGPFTATMTAHFFATKNDSSGKPIEWWTFSTAIKGTMTLRYPKEAAGTAVQMSGQLDGGATRFTYSEDAFNSELFGYAYKGGTIYKTDVAPVPTDDGEGGAFNAVVSATSFYIPISGTLVGNKITVTLHPSQTDFNKTYTTARTVFAVTAPVTLHLPVWGHFELPYMNAHFIFEHLIQDGNDNKFDVVRQGDKMIITRKTNKTLPGPQNSATYTLDLKACNPDCQ